VKKNVASQVIGAQMVTASDGSAFTSATSVAVTVDGGTQTAGGGTGPTHEGNGFHSYLPTQAETNGDHIAFTFTGSGAIPVTVQVYTDFPQTGDAFDRLGAPAGASVSADIATVDGNVDAILADTADMQPKLGTPAGASISADIATVDANVDAVLVDTGTTIPATLGSPAGADMSTDIAAIKTDTGNLVTRITATLFSGITSLAEWLGLLGGKQAGDATALTELKATGAGSGTFDPTTDSLEALRDTEPHGTAMRGTDSAATAAGLATAQADLDLLTGADGATLATSQPNYAPATAAGLATAQADLDLLTGADGATLATSQPNYAPATAAALTTHDGKLDTVDANVDAILVDTGTTIPAILGTPSDLGSGATLADNLSDIDGQIPAAPVKNAAYTYVIKMVDSSDHVTPKTGLTITMTRSLDAAAFASATGTVTEISSGHYKIAASAADMNGDTVTHYFAASGADDLTVEFKTVS